ncbi:unnamed protein product, partial [Rotaria sordida]
KQRFANVILTRFNTFAPSFPVTFIFSDGRSIQLVLFACTATGAFPLVVFAPAALKITTTTRVTVCSLQWNPIGTTIAGDGTPGVGLQQLRGPEDVFVDPFNTVIVSDTGNNRIQRWVVGAGQGVTIAGQTGGGAGAGANQFNLPEGVVVLSNGDIYVADSFNNRVQFWPAGGGAAVTLPNPPVAGRPYFPSGIAYDPVVNRLFVTDINNNRVIQYTLPNPVAGAVVAGPNIAPNPLVRPTGIYFDAASNSLVIANSGANNILQWFLTTITFAVVAGSPAGVAAAAFPNTQLNFLTIPSGVTPGLNGNIIVADSGNRRIMLFPPGPPTDGTKNGRVIAGTGAPGATPNQLSNPTGVSTDAQEPETQTDNEHNDF